MEKTFGKKRFKLERCVLSWKQTFKFGKPKSVGKNGVVGKTNYRLISNLTIFR